MKFVRTVTSMLLTLLFLTQGAYASEADSHPSFTSASQAVMRWANVSKVSLDLSFAGGKAQCAGKVVGNAGTTSISATITLERKNTNGSYSYVTSWSTSTSSTSLPFSYSHSVSSGYTYRLSISTKVTTNGVTETVNSSTENRY